MELHGEPIKQFILVDGKRHEYILQKMDKIASYVTCVAAGIDRAVANSDLAEFIFDLPDQIRLKKEERETLRPIITFRVSAEEKKFIEEKIFKTHGSVSEYMRELLLGPAGDRN